MEVNEEEEVRAMRTAIVCLMVVVGSCLVALPGEAITCAAGFQESCRVVIVAGKPRQICTCVGIPQNGVVIPRFYITHVIYAIPGKKSTITYSAGSTSGSTTTITSSSSSNVTASYKAGFALLATFDYKLSFGKEWGSTDEHETDVVTTETNSYTTHGGADLVNHDDDEIFFLVRPRLLTTITPVAPRGANVQWAFDPQQDLTRFSVLVGQLKHPCLMPASTKLLLESWGITEDDYPQFLRADPFANGSTAIDQTRFHKIASNFTYTPAAFNVDPSSWHHDLKKEDATSETITDSVKYTVGIEVTGGVNFIGMTKLYFNGSYTWSNSSSKKTTTGTVTQDGFDLMQPPFGYDGPEIVDVYVDTIWKTYLFVVGCGAGNAGPCSTSGPCSAEGAKVCQAAGATGCEARPNQRELCRWDGATKDQLDSNPPLTQCGPEVPDPNTVISCAPRYGIWTSYGTGWPVWDKDGACITQTSNLCSSAGFDACLRHGATSCEKITNIVSGTRFDQCRWQGVGPDECGTIYGPGPHGNRGIWAWATDDYSVNNPGTVQDGFGSCTSMTSNLPAQGISVVAGTYGGNVGAPHGNVSSALARACDSRNGNPNPCTYAVDYTQIGDPAPGLAKDYVAEWMCDGVKRATAVPEAGYGSPVALSCPAGTTISVLAGTYGGNCNAQHGNASDSLAAACSSLGNCTYVVDYTKIGDPAPGCGKDFVAEWMCTKRASAAAEAGWGSTVTLSCP
jgi:hypothetical protein